MWPAGNTRAELRRSTIKGKWQISDGGKMVWAQQDGKQARGLREGKPAKASKENYRGYRWKNCCSIPAVSHNNGQIEKHPCFVHMTAGLQQWPYV